MHEVCAAGGPEDAAPGSDGYGFRADLPALDVDPEGRDLEGKVLDPQRRGRHVEIPAQAGGRQDAAVEVQPPGQRPRDP